ncbi:MAG TPA: hypothetical protein VF115_07035, partial [Acidimicrobiia bacterium]
MRHTRTMTAFLVALAMVVVAACGDDEPEQTGTPESLTILAHNSFADAVGEETFATFESETGIEVKVLAGG